MKKSKIAKIIEILFKIILIVGIICIPFIPTLYEEVNELVGLLPSFVERITSSVNDTLSDYSTTTQMNSAINQKANQIIRIC